MFYVYILRSREKRPWSYVGCTSDIDRRFKEHQQGKVRSTKGYRPLDIVHTEPFENESDARNRELYLKSGIGREEKKQLIARSRVV